MALVEVRVPDIGDFKDVEIIELMVKPGDTVAVDQSLLTVESDKASMEIPSSHAGKVLELKVKLGDKVGKGALVLMLDEAGAAGSPSPQPSPASGRGSNAADPSPAGSRAQGSPSPQPSPAGGRGGNAPAPSPTGGTGGDGPAPSPAARERAGGEGGEPAAMPAHAQAATLAHASPSVRLLARELGVPLGEVQGTGPKGRITPADLHAFVKSVMAGSTRTQAQHSSAPASVQAAGAFPGLLPWPQVDFSQFGPIERKDLGRIRRISAANLHRNWVLIPHVTNHDDADITELEAFRVQLNSEDTGTKVTLLAFLIKASVAALKKFPQFNASLESTSSGEQLVLKNYFHIGFAADTPGGLVVPVVRDADRKGLLQISQEVSELARKARESKLSPADMSGGCFSISSLGGIGGRYFTPIINAPEVAILGVCRSSTEPRWDGKQFVPRLMLPLSLSWDHRVIDGAAAARFNVFLCATLADLRRVLL